MLYCIITYYYLLAFYKSIIQINVNFFILLLYQAMSHTMYVQTVIIIIIIIIIIIFIIITLFNLYSDRLSNNLLLLEIYVQICVLSALVARPRRLLSNYKEITSTRRK